MDTLTRPWRKSTASNPYGSCVQAASGWRKSSHSANDGACVEAGDGGTVTLVRDSQDPAGPVLAFSPAAWTEFTDSLKAGRL